MRRGHRDLLHVDQGVRPGAPSQDASGRRWIDGAAGQDQPRRRASGEHVVWGSYTEAPCAGIEVPETVASLVADLVGLERRLVVRQEPNSCAIATHPASHHRRELRRNVTAGSLFGRLGTVVLELLHPDRKATPADVAASLSSDRALGPSSSRAGGSDNRALATQSSG